MTTLAATTLAMHAGFWGPGPGILFLLIPLFWIAVLAVLFAVLRRRGRGPWGPGGPGAGGQAGWGPRSAERTLAERFARGDIDEVEYRARLEVLRAS